MSGRGQSGRASPLAPRLRGLILGAATLGAGGAWAHHSFAVFDASRSVTVSGTVREFRYTNPHIWIDLTTTDADGRSGDWSIEGAPPSQLRSQGWSPGILKTGDRIIAVIHPRRDGTHAGSMVELHFADGTPVGTPRAASAANASSSAGDGAGAAAGVGAARGTSSAADRSGQLDKPPHPLLAALVPQLKFGFYRQRSDAVQRSVQLPPSPDPRDLRGRYSPVEATLLMPGERGRMASYTDRGARLFRARAEEFLAGKLRADPLSLCKPGGTVRALNQGFTVQVMQSADEITIVHMEEHLVRRIHLSGARPAQPAPSTTGYSRGHWEGNTLVVETRAFRDGSWMDEYGNPGSDQLMLLERYTKQPNGSLRIEATVNDPVYYSEPVRMVRNWSWTPNVTWDEMICEENNRDAPAVKP